MFRSDKACGPDLTTLGDYKWDKWLYSVDGGDTIWDGIII